MAYKVFVSYKYHDNSVHNLNSFQDSTARDYVDEMITVFERAGDVIYKGEHDKEDLSNLSDDKIWEHLKNKIYDSSVTIVLISPNMKDPSKSQKDQWIPWEVSYSLKETTRNDRTSHSNAMLAVVLPDLNNSYNYYLEPCTRCGSTCVSHHTEKLFPIIRENKFNLINANISNCSTKDEKIWYSPNPSYIKVVKWCDFIGNHQQYIEDAISIKEYIKSYDIHVEVKDE